MVETSVPRGDNSDRSIPAPKQPAIELCSTAWAERKAGYLRGYPYSRPATGPRRIGLGDRTSQRQKTPQRPAGAISEDAFVVRHPRRPNVALPTVGRPSSNR